jgi:hypothetical protein
MFYVGEVENHMVLNFINDPYFREAEPGEYEEEEEEKDVDDEAICEICKYGIKDADGFFIEQPHCKGCGRAWCEISSNFESKDGFEYEIKGGELVRKEKDE